MSQRHRKSYLIGGLAIFAAVLLEGGHATAVPAPLPGGPGGAQGVCVDNYAKFGFPIAWESHPADCLLDQDVTVPHDDCEMSFSEFCDADGNGIVDANKRGAGATVYDGPGLPIPMACPCPANSAVPPTEFECIKFEPSSPPPPDPSHLPHGNIEDACDFYGRVIAVPGSCSEEEKTLLGGYHQTCRNATIGRGRGPNGGLCDSNTTFRRYADGLRHCIQAMVSNGLTTYENCLDPGTTCSEVVDSIRDAHYQCNNVNDFCGVMSDPDAAYCFGLAIGDAWGAYIVGTLPKGGAAPLGFFPTAAAVLSCGGDWYSVQGNMCQGYRDACMEAVGGKGLITSNLCFWACPPPTYLLVSPLIGVPALYLPGLIDEGLRHVE